MTEHIVIRGGAGGTTVTIEHLRHGAQLLRAAADLLDDAASAARWAQDEGLGPTPACAVTRARAHAALAPVVRGWGALDRHADEARRLSTALDQAAEAYERAEDDAGVALRGVLASVGHQAGERPVGSLVLARLALPGILLAAVGLHVTGRPRVDLARLATTDPAEHVVQALAGFVRGLAPGTRPPDPQPVVEAAELLTAAIALAGRLVPSLARRPLRVTARVGASRGDATPPRTPTDLLARIRELYPKSGGIAGTVGIDRLDHPDGTRTWVVTIPGTQAMSFGTSELPMDMATNVRLMAEALDDGSELVARALEQAGARPGEPVLLAGHSQGGLVATALANNAAFTARHPVAAVVTAGSPVATLPVPPDTAALHFEHRQDLVPASDGWDNPDVPHRTTAVRDLGASPLAVDRRAAGSPGAAHGVDAYIRTATAVAAAGGTSVRAWERSAATVLGGPGVVVRRFEFIGEREPAPVTGRIRAPGAGPVGTGTPGPVVASGGSRTPGGGGSGPADAPHRRGTARTAAPLSASGSPR